MSHTEFITESNSVKNIFCSLVDFLSMIDLSQLTHSTFAIVLAFVPAILSISYPLIIQIIGRLDNQYGSTHIVKRFQQESLHKWFIGILIVSVSTTIAGFVFHPAIIALAFVSVVALLVQFFRYIQLLLIYQNAEKLFERYLKKTNFPINAKQPVSTKKTENAIARFDKYWHPVTDLLLFSIKKENRELEDNIRILFMFPGLIMIEEKESLNTQQVCYPSKIYNSIHLIIAHSLRHTNSFSYQPVEQYITLYFPTYNSKKDKLNYIHTETWRYLWKGLSLLVENNRGDKILSYWESAHQHYLYHFSWLPVANKTIELGRNVNNKHRRRFYQFHVALGAYLYHKKDYQTLKNIWGYSHSEPPEYVLHPQTMDGVFALYFDFLDPRLNNTDYTIEYWFKDMSFDHMNFQRDAKTVIREYICLLYLRQWMITSLYGIDPLHKPEIPVKQHTKRVWEDHMIFFKELVNKHLSNKKLLKELGLDIFTSADQSSTSKTNPLDYIDEIQVETQKKRHFQLKHDQLSPLKLNLTMESTIKSIRDIYQDFKRIADNEFDEKERDLLSQKMPYFGGVRLPMDKEALVDNQSMAFLSYDKVLGESVLMKYAQNILSKLFYLSSSNTYVLQHGKLLEAVKRLNLQPQKHMIISLGIFLEYYEREKLLKKAGNNENADYNFSGVPVYSFKYAIPPNQAGLYIMSFSDRPMLKHHSWKDILNIDQETKKYWESFGSPIDEELYIYFKATDVGNYEYLDERNDITNNIESSDIKTELNVDFLASCWFKKRAQILFLREGEPGQEGGNIKPLSEIKPFV